MITYPQFHLASAPLTGASWIVLTMKELGYQCDGIAVDPFRPCLSSCTRLKLSLARHPCDWLWNYYCTGVRIFPEEMSVFGLLRQLDRVQPFEDFVVQYLKQCPGMIGQWVLSYKADTYQKYEDQPHAFIELMGSLGVNCSSWSSHWSSRSGLPVLPSRLWKPALRQQLMEAERDYTEHFDYW